MKARSVCDVGRNPSFARASTSYMSIGIDRSAMRRPSKEMALKISSGASW